MLTNCRSVANATLPSPYSLFVYGSVAFTINHASVSCVSEMFLCKFCSRSVRDGRMGLGGFPTTEALCGSSNDMGPYSLSLYGYVDLVNWNSWSEDYPPIPPSLLPHPTPIPYPVPTSLVPIPNTSDPSPPPPTLVPTTPPP